MIRHGSNRSRFFALGIALFTLASCQPMGAAVSEGDHSTSAVSTTKAKDIVETAVSAGNFNTLAKAIEAAGLVDELKGAGPFTVFAPTDDAFAKLPAGTVEDLLKPENKEKLRAVLLYHVVQGKYDAAQVSKLNGKSVQTLQGGKVMIRTSSGVRVDDAKVVKTDVIASNGVIHVIDTVLLPKADTGGKK
jgi:uncharacterized surface protein with fasciclin (FAS1) repeats